MRIAVIGTGYVGLVTGTCFAESGNEVTCVDIDREKIESPRPRRDAHLRTGLGELVSRNFEAQRLHFTTDAAAAVKTARLVFLAVGTPASERWFRRCNGSVESRRINRSFVAARRHRRHQKHRARGHSRKNCHQAQRTNRSRLRCRQQSGVFQGRGGAGRFPKARSRCRRSPPAGSRRSAARLVRPISAHRKAVSWSCRRKALK